MITTVDKSCVPWLGIKLDHRGIEVIGVFMHEDVADVISISSNSNNVAFINVKAASCWPRVGELKPAQPRYIFSFKICLMANMVIAVAYIDIQQTVSNIIIPLELCLCPPVHWKSKIHAHFNSGFVLTKSWEKYLAL